MNAYELADKAEQLKTGEYGYVDGWMDEAADMLRQQADRIAELEKHCLDLCFSEAYANQSTKVTEDLLLKRIETLENQLDKYSHYEAMSHQEYMQQITELEKEKIRAYDNGYEDGQKSLTSNYKYDPDTGEPLIDGYPLYSGLPTPQTKPLSDSELIVFLMDDIDKASQWLVEGQTHMAIGVLGQCHAEIRKHLSKKSKPLSDEEIIKLFWDASWGTDEDVVKFARAIEERHGIK